MESADRLDLHGFTLDEALPGIDDFLYQAYKSGLFTVWIIHGKGTGILRREVTRKLASHPLVRSFYAADRYHGSSGATQVNLIST